MKTTYPKIKLSFTDWQTYLNEELSNNYDSGGKSIEEINNIYIKTETK